MANVNPVINNYSLPNEEVGYAEGGYHPGNMLASIATGASDAVQPVLQTMYNNQLAAKNAQVSGDITAAADTMKQNIYKQYGVGDPQNYARINQGLSDWWNNYQNGLTIDQKNFSNDYMQKMNLAKQSEVLNEGVEFNNKQALGDFDTFKNNALKSAPTDTAAVRQMNTDQIEKMRMDLVGRNIMKPDEAALDDIQHKANVDINVASNVALSNPSLAQKMVAQSDNILPQQKYQLTKQFEYMARIEQQQNDSNKMEEFQSGLMAKTANGIPLNEQDLMAQVDASPVSAHAKIMMNNMVKTYIGQSARLNQNNNILSAVDKGQMKLDPNDPKSEEVADTALYNASKQLQQSGQKGDPVLSTITQYGVVPKTVNNQWEAISKNPKTDPQDQIKMIQQISAIDAQVQGTTGNSILSQLKKPTQLLYNAVEPQIKAGIKPEVALAAAQQELNPEDKSVFKDREKEAPKILAKNDFDLSHVANKLTPLGSQSVNFLTGQPVSPAFYDPQTAKADYNELWKANYVHTGDADQATTTTQQEMAKTYGYSEENGSRQIVKYPMSQYYSKFGITDDDIKKDINDKIHNAPGVGPNDEFGKNIFLQADNLTAAHLPFPSKALVKYDPATKTMDLLRSPDGLVLRYAPDVSAAAGENARQKALAEAMQQNMLNSEQPTLMGNVTNPLTTIAGGVAKRALARGGAEQFTTPEQQQKASDIGKQTQATVAELIKQHTGMNFSNGPQVPTTP